MTGRRRALIAACLVVAVGAIVASGGRRERGMTAVEVIRGDLSVGVEVTGSLAATRSEFFGPPQVRDLWEYKITQIAGEGSEVKPQQPIVSFDTSELQRRLQQYEAEKQSASKEIERREAALRLEVDGERLKLAEAEARLRKAAMKLDAPEELTGAIERKSVTIEHDVATREVAFRKARLQSIETAAREEIRLLTDKRDRAAIRVSEIEAEIDAMTVRATRAGMVILVSNWRGDKKKVGDNCWIMEKVAEIPDLSSLMANGEVDEAETGRLARAQRVSLRLDAHPDDEISGRVTAIGTTVQRRSPREPDKVLRIQIALDRIDSGKMRPGMRFRGEVVVDAAEGVLLVPLDAITENEGRTEVQRKTLTGAERVDVRLGRRNRTHAEVISGVEEGDRVLVRRESR